MREMSVAEQRYLAVLAVIADGHDVASAAQQWGGVPADVACLAGPV
jgi:hypothetical protein